MPIREGFGDLDLPLIFAHRGGLDGGHPQNTIAALKDALARGLSLESDVRLSADGDPVLVHDSVLWRVRPITVARKRSKQLAGYAVATLANFYEELGTDFELSLDIKVREAAERACEVAAEVGALERLWLVHDDLGLLASLRRRHPEVKLVHETRLADLARRQVPLEDHVRHLSTHGISAQNTHWADWTPEAVDRVHELGILAFGSLAQDLASMRDALGRGLDGVYTDHLDQLLAARSELYP